VRFPVGKRVLLFSKLSRLALRLIQTPIQWVPEVVNKGQKQWGCRGGHLLSRSTEVTNVLNYTYPNPHALMVCTFMFRAHLIHLPTKSAKENIYTASNAFLVVTCFHSHLKNIRKCWTSSENVSRISHSMMESVSMGEWCREPCTQWHRATLLGEPQVLLYSATKFAEYYIQVQTLYIHKCSIPKALLSVWSCIALASYKDTKVVWSESVYEPVLLWNCTVSSRLAAFTLADILVYQLIVTCVYLHCLFHYKIYIPMFVVYQPRRCVSCQYWDTAWN
jgi:hypothetical protein